MDVPLVEVGLATGGGLWLQSQRQGWLQPLSPWGAVRYFFGDYQEYTPQPIECPPGCGPVQGVPPKTAKHQGPGVGRPFSGTRRILVVPRNVA